MNTNNNFKPDCEYSILNLIKAYVSGTIEDYELQSAYNHIDFTEDYSDWLDRYDIEYDVPFCWSRLRLYSVLMKLLKDMKTGKPFTDKPNYDDQIGNPALVFSYNVLLENYFDRYEICERIIRHLWKNEPLLNFEPKNKPWGYDKYANVETP
jgi:hypothetical protein